jgi:hypothetical protein
MRGSDLSRRRFLGQLLTASAAASTWSLLGCGRAKPAPVSQSKLRYFVLILAPGGIDAIVTTDAKQQKDVDATVDIPYGPSDVIEVNGVRYGPHMKPLQKWLPSLAVINNVQVKTANHPTGETQFSRLRTLVTERMPTMGDIIGWHRDGQPIGAVALGRRVIGSYSSGELDCARASKAADLCEYLDGLPLPTLQQAAADLDELVTRSTSSPETARHSRDTATFLRQFAATPKFKATEWVKDRGPEWSSPGFFGKTPSVPARDLQRTLWLLENDLTRSVTIGAADMQWDSHNDNFEWQTQANATYFPLFARFLDELHTRRNKYGVLAEQTMVIFGSELGRFPVINDHLGKDHWPEAPYFFFGPNIATKGARGPIYGASNQRLEALPIDLKTGYAATNGIRPTLDDVGATVLDAFGIAPDRYGYTGHVLPFLTGA